MSSLEMEYFPPKLQETSTILYSITSQKIVLSVITAVGA
jgi:hypothetical protein